MVCRSSDEKWVLQVRSHELSRPAPLLCPVAVAEFVWPESVGDTVAGRTREHRLCLAGFEVRAVGGPKRQQDSRAGDGDLARVRVLWALRHSRSMAAIVLDDVHPGTAWVVEIGQAELSLVCRHGTSRHDSNEGDIRHSCGVRGNCDSGSGGFFLNWSGVKGLYQAFKAWTETGAAGHGHEKPWDYWFKIMGPSLEFRRADFLGYELPMLVGLILCVFCQKLKNVSLRYLAIYGVGSFIAYSYVKYKTPWCIISFGWPFLYVFGAAVLLVRPKRLRLVYRTVGVLLCISLGSSIWLNYFRCSSPDEPYAYVQTYNDIFKLTTPLLKLAKRDPAYYHLTGHLIRPSAYPLPWVLGDFDRVGYYEGGNMPANLDGDFLLVQQDKIKDVESKLKGAYYTDMMTLRNYQEPSKIFFSAKVFKEFFPGKAPDFVGKPSG